MSSNAHRTLIGVDLGGSGFRVRRIRLVSRKPLTLEVDDDEEGTEHLWTDGVFDSAQSARVAKKVGLERCALIAAKIGRLIGEGDSASTLVAIAAPGKKTADGRGIEHALYFPVIRDLAGAVERELAMPGVELALPIVGDGVAAARGEQVDPNGKLRDIERGYYLGGGTGVSEALVVDGQVFALSELESTLDPIDFILPDVDPETTSIPFYSMILPTSSMLHFWPVDRGKTFGRESARDRRRRRAAFQLALRERQPETLEFLDRLVVEAFHEVVAIRRDWQWEHRPEASTPLERVVLGQDYARLFEGELALPLLQRLGPEYCISHLRAAPAIGAVAFALEPQRKKFRQRAIGE